MVLFRWVSAHPDSTNALEVRAEDGDGPGKFFPVGTFANISAAGNYSLPLPRPMSERLRLTWTGSSGGAPAATFGVWAVAKYYPYSGAVRRVARLTARHRGIPFRL